ncbi:MAG: phosphatase PAP2 family protein [Gemmataceae bacterium]
MEYFQAADEGALYWCGGHHTLLRDNVMEFFTHLGDAETTISVLSVAMIHLFVAGRQRTAIILLLASTLGLGFSQSMKYLIMRERPDVAWRLIDRPASPSFPSGHSLNSMAIYGSMALLASRHVRHRGLAMLILVVGFALSLAIGISRPYLGVHYPSDVLAGWTGGLAYALLALWADQRWGDRVVEKINRG